MSDPVTPKLAPSYRRQWVVAFLGIGLLVAGIIYKTTTAPDLRPPELPGPEQTDYADWFMAVRCPEMPLEAGESDSGTELLGQWMKSLKAEGFHPRPFSEVMMARQNGEQLPEKTVVLLFHPSYRITVEKVLPKLQELKVPALYVTEPPGAIRADRRFVSNHARREYSKTELWDFAAKTGDDSFRLESDGWPAAVTRDFQWTEEAGITGINDLFNESPLKILYANARWTEEEFVNRLKADLPLRNHSRLSIRRIQEKQWGILADEDDAAAFDLEAKPDSRFASVTWTGSRGVGDLELELNIGSWHGEAWLFLRSNTDRTERIRIGLMENSLRILQERNGSVLSDQKESLPLQPAEGAHLIAKLQGDRLILRLPGLSGELQVPVSVPAAADSAIEFALYDRIHGVAVARDVSVTAVPLDASPQQAESQTESQPVQNASRTSAPTHSATIPLLPLLVVP